MVEAGLVVKAGMGYAEEGIVLLASLQGRVVGETRDSGPGEHREP